MRPKELILHNIGPFTGEHTVNFDSLGSLFLIYGQTGAGKTTLFDAISYAFYGKPLIDEQAGNRCFNPKSD